MTEQKTYKHGDFTEYDWGYYVDAEGDIAKYPGSEWDMEITFTRKVKPFEVGDVVKLVGWKTYTVTILAIYETEAWVMYDDSSTDVVNLSELQHAS